MSVEFKQARRGRKDASTCDSASRMVSLSFQPFEKVDVKLYVVLLYTAAVWSIVSWRRICKEAACVEYIRFLWVPVSRNDEV